MTAEPLVLTFDIGTQSTRAILVRRDGSFYAIEKIKYDEPYYSKHEGWAEQRPDFYFECICLASHRIMVANPEAEKNVIAVCLTCIRDSSICLGDDNKPVSDVFLWLDKREADDNGCFSFSKDMIFRLVGMTDSAKMQFRASVCNWIMQNDKALWSSTKKFVMLPTYLNYLMTGKLTDSAANMIGHIPFDYKGRCWQGAGGLTRCITDIPADMLPPLVESGSVLGKITDTAAEKLGVPAGLPLIATGSDKGCETLGLAVAGPGTASLSFGTSATIQVCTDKYFEPQKFMPAYPAVVEGFYNPEIQIFRGYWTVSWFIREFGAAECEEAAQRGISPEEVFDEHLDEVPPGCEGLILQPYWTPGITIPAARGAVIGFNDRHTKYHFYRSIIEGIDFALYDAKNMLEKRGGVPITELHVSGGGSEDDRICQITADVFGLPVKRIQTHEACGLGASVVAFTAMKVFPDIPSALSSMVHVTDTFEPDKKAHEIYMKLYDGVYKKMYARLAPLYKQEKNIYFGSVHNE